MALQTKTFSYGSVTDKSVLNGYVLELTVTEQSTDTVNNTSLVDYVLKLRSGSKNRFTLYGLGAEVSLDGKVVGSRDRYEAAQVSLGYNTSVTLVSGSTTVAHSDDGSKTMAVAFSIDMKAGDYTPGPVSVTGKTMALTAIPRASTIAASDANIGSVSTVVVGRKSTAFTHTVAVTFGSLSGYIGAEGAFVTSAVKLKETTLPFQLPDSFYAQIPNKTSGTCTLTCTTYSGTSVIGTKKTTFTVTAAKSLCLPAVAISVKDISEKGVALTGDNAKLVRYVSTARCAVSATAKNSATVKALKVDGTAVSSGTVDFAAVERGSFKAVCTDSRGYSNSDTAEVTLIPYVKLTCNASAKRLQPTDGTARLTIKGNYFHGSFGAKDNSLTLTYQIGTGEPVSVTPTVSGNTYTAVVDLGGLDYTQSFAIMVTAEDAVATVPKSVTLQPGVPVFDWGKSDFAFHVPVSINGVTLDYVVEQGTKNGWLYRKWQSGLAECWYRKEHAVVISEAWGNLYAGTSATGRTAYPFAFTEKPHETVTVKSTTPAVIAACSSNGGGDNTTTATASYNAIRPTALTEEYTVFFEYYVVGYWK